MWYITDGHLLSVGHDVRDGPHGQGCRPAPDDALQDHTTGGTVQQTSLLGPKHILFFTYLINNLKKLLHFFSTAKCQVTS